MVKGQQGLNASPVLAALDATRSGYTLRNARLPYAKPTLRYSELMIGPMLTMMRRGVQIDITKRDAFVAKLRDRIRGVSQTFDFLCESLFDTTINWNSTPQLKLLFYRFLAIP